ncbi:MAG TPA: hypothetical protein VN861_08450 [Candidatus Acidoferrales bacterium]|nr:hypothetical protein [Candidatus Acidoferrales bacterium]
MAANLGPIPAGKIVQMALLDLRLWPFPADGLFCLRTTNAVNEAPAAMLLSELRARSALYHSDVVMHDARLNVFLLGWLRRDIL